MAKTHFPQKCALGHGSVSRCSVCLSGTSPATLWLCKGGLGSRVLPSFHSPGRPWVNAGLVNSQLLGQLPAARRGGRVEGATRGEASTPTPAKPGAGELHLGAPRLAPRARVGRGRVCGQRQLCSRRSSRRRRPPSRARSAPTPRSPAPRGHPEGFVSAPYIAADSCHLLCLVTPPRRSPFLENKPALVIKPQGYFLTTPTPSCKQALLIRPRLSLERQILLPYCVLGAVWAGRPIHCGLGPWQVLTRKGGESASLHGCSEEKNTWCMTILMHRISVLQMQSVNWARVWLWIRPHVMINLSLCSRYIS